MTHYYMIVLYTSAQQVPFNAVDVSTPHVLHAGLSLNLVERHNPKQLLCPAQYHHLHLLLVWLKRPWLGVALKTRTSLRA